MCLPHVGRPVPRVSIDSRTPLATTWNPFGTVIRKVYELVAGMVVDQEPRGRFGSPAMITPSAVRMNPDTELGMMNPFGNPS